MERNEWLTFVGKLRKFRGLPELASLLIATAAWCLVMLPWPWGLDLSPNIWGPMGVHFWAAVIATGFYGVAKRPRMWNHLPIHLSPYLISAVTDPSVRHYPIATPIMIPITLVLAFLFHLLPVVLVCFIYSGVFRKRFAKTTTQGGENP